jgi:signal transduction histidine kinase
MGSAGENPGRVILLAGLTAGAVCLGLLWPLHVTAVGGRAGIETAIPLLALLSALLFGSRFRRTRRIDDLALAAAVAIAGLAELAFATLPAIAGLSLVARGNEAAAGVTAAVAVGIAVMALAPPHEEIRWRRRRTTGPAASALARPRLPASLATALLTAGCLLLTSAGLQGLLSRQAADWVTPGDGLRLVAYGIVVAVAVWRHAEMREAVAAAALNAERKRMARELHDGLAQDLAFIAVYAQGLNSDLGPEHPLLIAARRALDASRGLMADLAARSAPTTGAALALVADELAARFGVRVEVRSAPVMALTGRADLGPPEREEIVMIAREAIVNAITHGHAQRIDVTLDLEDRRPLLRVSDDGGGVRSGTPHGGFGLPTMRARAESLGGRLVMRRGAAGGTELEVCVAPQARPLSSGVPDASAPTRVVPESPEPVAVPASASSSSPIAARSSRRS